jgi:NAD(P)-dependent dehydrogenase (short-subunit alcohol dehydrogenase family)
MPPDHGFDRLLDRAVPIGYSRLGFLLRRRFTFADDPPPTALSGRRILVTGAAGGLGEATALGLARLGAAVHLLARSHERAAPAADRISAKLSAEGLSAEIETEVCDVSDLASVREFAAGFAERLPDAGAALDGIVHNAGVLPERRSESVDGHELTVATHVLGPLLMTEALRPVLARSATGARVVFVASGGMYAQRLHVDDLEYEDERYRGAVAYARSKRMQVELTAPLAERLADDRVDVHAMHPGWVNTPGIAAALPGFRKFVGPLLRDADAGADTIVWLLAADPAPRGGGFWHDRAERPANYFGAMHAKKSEVDALWEWALRAVAV